MQVESLVEFATCAFMSEMFHVPPEKSSLAFHVCELEFLCEDFFESSAPVDTKGNKEESEQRAVEGCWDMYGV